MAGKPNRRTRKTKAAAAFDQFRAAKMEALAAPDAGDPMPASEEITPRQARVLQMQGQFLIQQVQSLCNRLGGEKMAAGLVNAQGAALFANQELAKIEAGLKEIEASIPAEAKKV